MNQIELIKLLIFFLFLIFFSVLSAVSQQQALLCHCHGRIGFIIKEIGKCLWGPIKRHATYLFCYRQNVHILETELTGLEQRRSNVQLDVEAARRQGQEVRGEVEKWLTDVASTKSDAERIVARLETTKCCKGWCWDPNQCYRLGKEAAEISTVAKGQRECNFTAVSRPPPPPRIQSLLPSRGSQAFESTKSYMEQILNALKDDQIHIIGVHGMGGVGKTTLMEEVAKQAEREKLFSKIVMVTVSQNVLIENIQKEIEEKLGLRVEEESKQVRAARLSKRLKEVEKASLVILDDLWEKLELSDMGIPCGDEDNGCKVVITSRRWDVCNRMKSQINIEVKPLIGEEPWNLFLANAGSVVNSNEVSEVARNVVAECKGLPLAIVVLGQTLSKEGNVRVWNAILERLKQSIPEEIEGMEKEVFQSIEFSFDHLRSDETQMCFLFCSLFPEDYDIDLEYITWYMIGERKIEISETLEKAKDQVSLLFNKLMASGLLLQGEKEGSVRMHDIVRDVAIWISKRTNYEFYSKPRMGLTEWPREVKEKECQRMSLMYNKIDKLPEVPPFPHLRTLLLSQRKRYKEIRRIPNTFFSQMNELNILDLRRNSISSLPTSISCLKNLKVLVMGGCKLENLDGIGTLTSLEILKLSHITTDNVLPAELGELTSLRHLNLTGTKQRIPSNVISRLSRLEELRMLGGFSEWQVEGNGDTSRASFAELVCLHHLVELYINVDDEGCFLQDLGHPVFQKVVRFRILYKFDKVCRKPFKSDKVLRLPTSKVTDWAQLLARRTEELQLYSCPEMKCLIGVGGGNIPNSTFSNIKILGLSGLQDLGTFCHGAPPDGFFRNLHFLQVSSCRKLIDIFSSDIMSTICELRYLEEMVLEDLPQLTCIWEGDVPPGSLNNFQQLSVKHCNKLEYVFSPKVASALEQLKTMELTYLSGLTCIWEGSVPPGSLCKLQKLSVSNCDSLEHVFSPTFASALEQLELMCLENLPRLTRIWKGDVPPRSLQNLSVCNCHSLEHVFSPTFALALEQLKTLELTYLSGLTYIWEGNVPPESLCKLQRLSVSNCDSLEHVFSPTFASALEQLELMWLQNLPRLTHIWKGDVPPGSLCKLQKLSVSNCDSLEHVFSPTFASALEQMEFMWLKNLSRLTHIWKGDVLARSLCKLKKLSVSNCDSLEHVFSPTFASALEQLKTLELTYLSGLTHIWKGDVPSGSLRKLLRVFVENCDNLEHVFSPIAALALEQLRVLKISQCRQMKEIIPSDLQSQSGLFLSLCHLKVERCDRLATLLSWRQVWNLRMLEELRVSECDNMVAIIMSEKENLQEVIADKTSVLPKLRQLRLKGLKISSFDEEGASCFDWPSLETLYIEDCPNLKKLPLRQQSIPKLQRLEGSEKWFRTLEWEDENIKSRLQNLFHPIL